MNALHFSKSAPTRDPGLRAGTAPLGQLWRVHVPCSRARQALVDAIVVRRTDSPTCTEPSSEVQKSGAGTKHLYRSPIAPLSYACLRTSAIQMGRTLTLVLRAVTAVALVGVPHLAQAQDHYPTRLIKIIVPFWAGTSVDLLPRLVAERLSSRWSQSVIVENRAGASGNIGAEAVARADPDGYTLLASPAPPLVINQYLYPKLTFDPDAFVAVTVLATVPNVLVVSPKVPVANVQELISYATANPDKLSYASPGNATTSHLTAEWLKTVSGIRILHVPYKGGAPALADLLAGHVNIMFATLGDVLPCIRTGKLNAIAVCSEERSGALPSVPSLSERFPGFVSIAWYAVAAPPKTPPEIVAKLSSAIGETLRMPDVAARLNELAATPVGGTPAETAAFMKDESQRWRKVIAITGVRLD